MDRIYLNARPGEHRIHIEIEAAEITDLIADLAPSEDDYPHDATRRLVEILRAANSGFETERKRQPRTSQDW